MTFYSVILKNIKHNLSKYLSIYLVNVMTVAMIFMYGSLLFNSQVSLGYVEQNDIKANLQLGLFILILFSFTFLIYTYSSLLKNRGKEFGTYMTIGLTRRELKKILFIENIFLYSISLITGLFISTIFGRVFFAGLNTILIGTQIKFELQVNAFILTISILCSIFLVNSFSSIILLRKRTILELLKTNSTSEIGKDRILFGVIALIVFVISSIIFPKVFFGEWFAEYATVLMYILVPLIFISLYFILGTIMAVFKNIARNFPNFYNKNILVITDISKKLVGYRNVVYILFVLLFISVFLTGLSYSMHSVTIDMLEELKPFDIMIVETDDFNIIEKNEIEDLFSKEDATISQYKTLEYLETTIFEESGDYISLWSHKGVIISESNYNLHTNSNLIINDNSAYYIAVKSDNIRDLSNITIVPLNEKDIDYVNSLYEKNMKKLSIENYNKFLKDQEHYSEIEGSNIEKELGVKYTNYLITKEFSSRSAFVISDDNYETLKLSNKTNVSSYHLINYSGDEKVFYELVDYLRIQNDLDDSYWQGVTDGYVEDESRSMAESYRPMSLKESIRSSFNSSGVLLFTMIFIGFLFSIGSGVVLYYKVVFDANNEKEKISSLLRIGANSMQIKSAISKQLLIIFLAPVVLGCLTGLYFISILTSNMAIHNEIVWKSSLAAMFVFALQLVFYLIGRSSYYSITGVTSK
ncbi:ABC transporter permease [Mycoplasmatota bacterium WC44]